jgi:hypothetical protein
MRLSYESKLRDYKAGYQLLRNRTFYSRRGLYFLLPLALLCGAAFEFSSPASATHVLIAYPLIYLVALSAGQLIVRLNPYLSYWRSHNRNQSSPASVTEVTPDRIVDMTGARETSCAWSKVTGFGQNEEATVVCGGWLSRVIFFPTSALTPGQRAELDELVTSHGIKRWS